MPKASFNPGCRVRRAPGLPRRVASATTLAALAALALGLGGCQAAQRCEPLRTCGGDPTSGAIDELGKLETEWVANVDGACMDELQLPVNPISLAQQPARTAGKKTFGQATVDWCSSLVLKPDGSIGYQGWFPIIPIKSAVLTLGKAGDFQAHFSAYAPQTMSFPASCRAAQGINESCPTLGRHIKEAIAAESNVTNTRCYDDGDGGCTCDYELLLLSSLPGTWAASDGKITFYDTSLAPSPPATADYCVEGDTLSVTGRNGSQLFNRPALRTMEFHRPTCTDKVQSHQLGETGVDCGGQCAPCGSCEDGVQSGDEASVDCGGSCPDFCPCFNGVQDPWEEGLDCGGTCSLLCTCKNGVADANEEGVDCGGDCQARYSEKAAVACP